jgi:pyruvate,water dikinase
MSTDALVLDFPAISLKDVALVGGKNASLGELFRALAPKGVGVLDGFATTSAAYPTRTGSRSSAPASCARAAISG